MIPYKRIYRHVSSHTCDHTQQRTPPRTCQLTRVDWSSTHMHTHAMCLCEYISLHHLHHRVQAHNSYTSPTPCANDSDYIYPRQGIAKVKTWVFETILCVSALSSIAGSTDQQTNRSVALYNCCQRHNASSTYDADTAMTMHSLCKKSMEHHQGTLLIDESHSVESCKAQLELGPRSVGTLSCRLAIARLRLDQASHHKIIPRRCLTNSFWF